MCPPPPAQERYTHSEYCWIVIYLGLAYTQLPVVSFTREALQLEGAARDRALRKLDLLEAALLTPIPNPRPM